MAKIQSHEYQNKKICYPISYNQVYMKKMFSWKKYTFNFSKNTVYLQIISV